MALVLPAFTLAAQSAMTNVNCVPSLFFWNRELVAPSNWSSPRCITDVATDRDADVFRQRNQSHLLLAALAALQLRAQDRLRFVTVLDDRRRRECDSGRFGRRQIQRATAIRVCLRLVFSAARLVVDGFIGNRSASGGVCDIASQTHGIRGTATWSLPPPPPQEVRSAASSAAPKRRGSAIICLCMRSTPSVAPAVQR